MISIIVPIYNKSKYLKNLLDSIRNQSYEDFECWLIDDGSTDDSSIMCDCIARDDARFRVVHTENQGVSAARNIGLKNASGEYVTFIDADDEVDKEYLLEMRNAIIRYDTDMCVSSRYMLSEDGKKREKIDYPFEERRYQMKELLPEFAELQNSFGVFGWCWGKLIKREKVGDVSFDEKIKLAEDLDFYLRIYPRIDSIVFSTKANYYYRQSAENSSTMIDDKDIDYFTQLKIRLALKQYLETEGEYTGNNKRIVDSSIENYVYFHVFHSDKGNFDERFGEIQTAIQENGLTRSNTKGLKGVLLKTIYYGNKRLAKLVVFSHHTFRKLVRNR